MGFMDKVKDMAGGVGDTLKKGVKNVSESSQKLSDKMKLKKKISDLEKEMNEIYLEIGKKYLETHKDGISGEMAEFADRINAINADVAAAQQELDELSDKMICPSCGVAVPKDQRFCDKCGAMINQPAPETPSEEPEHVDAEVVETEE